MPHSLIVDDDADTRDMLARVVAAEGYSVSAADTLRAARGQIARRTPDLILVDLHLPDGDGIELVREIDQPLATDVVLITGHASLDSAIEAVRLGASDYLTKPISVERLIQFLRRQPRTTDLKQQIGELRDELRQVGRFGHLVGGSPPMQELYDRIGRVAPTSAPVFLLGEKGSGKELAARTIHDLSRRRRAPYFVFDCSALPAPLIETELFGRERGSGEQRQVGILERVHGGTLVLSRMTTLPLASQVKLLRFLESGSFLPASASAPLSADVRIIATAEARPLSALAEGRFREDLLQRLEVFPIHIPPLRQRGSDVRMLAQRFLDELNSAEGTRKRFSRPALARLQEHTWPGNVRELKNYVHRAYLHAGSVIDGDETAAAEALAEDTDDLITFRIGQPLEEIERRVTMATLARCGGVKKRAAATLGISLKTLYNRLESYAAKDAVRSKRASAPAEPSSGEAGTKVGS
jgi:DNA-binding NtrC family response regulator